MTFIHPKLLFPPPVEPHGGHSRYLASDIPVCGSNSPVFRLSFLRLSLSFLSHQKRQQRGGGRGVAGCRGNGLRKNDITNTQRPTGPFQSHCSGRLCSEPGSEEVLLTDGSRNKLCFSKTKQMKSGIYDGMSQTSSAGLQLQAETFPGFIPQNLWIHSLPQSV